MNSDPITLFSEFLAMKRMNPSEYWRPQTHAQMIRSYKHYGVAYFDLHKDQAI
mgnify:FL=1|jgi:hypothetical protein